MNKASFKNETCQDLRTCCKDRKIMYPPVTKPANTTNTK